MISLSVLSFHRLPGQDQQAHKMLSERDYPERLVKTKSSHTLRRYSRLPQTHRERNSFRNSW